jgi:hypothetical protein
LLIFQELLEDLVCINLLVPVEDLIHLALTLFNGGLDNYSALCLKRLGNFSNFQDQRLKSIIFEHICGDANYLENPAAVHNEFLWWYALLKRAAL